jgi:hypothetical protein
MNGYENASVQVRIPVRIEKGKVTFFYPGSLPRIREGAVGDLVIDRIFLLDEAELKRLGHQEDYPLLTAGTVLRAVVDPKQDITGAVTRKSSPEGMENVAATHFVEVTLQDALMLRLRGTKPGVLRAARCRIPALGLEASTLNRAYSLIAEHFEPWRSSTAGNVFRKLYYRSTRNGQPYWRKLDVLRKAAEADLEARLYLPQGELFRDTADAKAQP